MLAWLVQKVTRSLSFGNFLDYDYMYNVMWLYAYYQVPPAIVGFANGVSMVD